MFLEKKSNRMAAFKNIKLKLKKAAILKKTFI